MRVAVVGGGVSGLAAAYRLTQRGASVTLYEASDRLGGVIRSERRDGYLMEGGPDCFLDKPPARQLCAELGLDDQLIRVRPEARHSFIVRGRRLLPIPEGLYLMAPSAMGPFARSSVVSWPGKARMLLDLVLPPRRSSGDESLASFGRRRLGREALERLAQPLLGGIYAADPERLSLAATMPQFLEMERRQGSILRALLRRRQAASGARYGLFLSFRNGMQTRVDALAARLSNIRLQTHVDSLAGLDADAICLALPAWAAAKLLAVPFDAEPYSSAATINLGFPAQPLPPGAGFVVPQVERRTLMACTFASQKFEGRAPEGKMLLRAFAGGMLNREAFQLADEQLVTRAVADLRELVGVGEPEAVWLTRCEQSMPQYEVGHEERMGKLEAGLPPNIALAGNGYRGVGVPDCLASGLAAAERLICGV